MTTLDLTFQIAVMGMAAFRLWRIAAVDSITEPFHGRLNASRHPVGRWFSDLVSCPWCLGFHLSILVWALWTFFPVIGVPTCLILATSTLVGFLGRLNDH
jgi:hypothetical protein